MLKQDYGVTFDADLGFHVPPSVVAPPHPYPGAGHPTNKRVCCLVSGGKDSIAALHIAHGLGYEIACLATLTPAATTVDDEADSYMFQSVGTTNVEKIAESMGLPLITRQLQGSSVAIDKNEYDVHAEDEVEDMFHVLHFAMEKFGVKFVTTGAVFSDYQRLRVESICTRLGLVSLAPLWRWPQEKVLEYVDAVGIKAAVVKTASMGLAPRCLGQTTTQLLPKFLQLNQQFGFHIAGEGGEYETLVLDAPLFKEPLVMANSREVSDGQDAHHLADIRLELAGADISPLSRPADNKASLDCWLDEVYTSCEFLSLCQPDSSTSGCVLDEHDNLPPHSQQILMGTTSLDLGNINILVDDHGLYEEKFSHQMTIPEDASMQARMLFRCLVVHLSRHHRATLRDVVHVDLQLANMKDFASVNKEYVEVFPARNPPTRCCVGARLPDGIKVRIRVLLVRPSRVIRLPDSIGYEPLIVNQVMCGKLHSEATRKVLHVQSMSSWAMACIGPYSQSHQVTRIEHVPRKGCYRTYKQLTTAGVLGCIAHSLSLPDGSSPSDAAFDSEVKHTMRSLEQILSVQGFSFSDVVVAKIFLNESLINLVPHSKFVYAAKCFSAVKDQLTHCGCAPDIIFVEVVVPDLPKHALVEVQLLCDQQTNLKCVANRTISNAQGQVMYAQLPFKEYTSVAEDGSYQAPQINGLEPIACVLKQQLPKGNTPETLRKMMGQKLVATVFYRPGIVSEAMIRKGMYQFHALKSPSISIEVR